MPRPASKKTIWEMGMAASGHVECLYMDKATYLEELLVFLNCVQTDFLCYCKICINKVVIWLRSQGCTQICGVGCGIVQLTG